MKRLLFSLVLIFLMSSFLSAQGIPETINYQGVLKDASGNVVPNGNYDLTFKLYDSEVAGTALWSETKNLAVTDGIINTQLGSATPLPSNIFDAALWLAIKVGAGSELTPRIGLASVPYSFYTMNVLDGSITASKIADGEVVKSLNGLKDNINLVAGSNVTITPSGQNITISSTGVGGLGGSGTTNYLPLFTNSTTLGNSSIFQSISGEIGIKTNDPRHSLDVNSDEQVGIQYNGNDNAWASIYVNALKTSASSGFGYLREGVLKAYTGLTTDDKWYVGTGMTLSSRLVVDASGNVGIGTTSPSAKLEVVGTATLSGTDNELNRAQTGNANLVPIAYASVNSNGTLYSNSTTTNVTLSSHTAGTGRYEFTITGENIFYQNYVCNVTLLSMGECYWNSLSGKLIIYTANSSGTPTDKIFSFVIYKK